MGAETPRASWLRRLAYDELVARDKASPDLIWLRDESLAVSAVAESLGSRPVDD